MKTLLSDTAEESISSMLQTDLTIVMNDIKRNSFQIIQSTQPVLAHKNYPNKLSIWNLGLYRHTLFFNYGYRSNFMSFHENAKSISCFVLRHKNETVNGWPVPTWQGCSLWYKMREIHSTRITS